MPRGAQITPTWSVAQNSVTALTRSLTQLQARGVKVSSCSAATFPSGTTMSHFSRCSKPSTSLFPVMTFLALIRFLYQCCYISKPPLTPSQAPLTTRGPPAGRPPRYSVATSAPRCNTTPPLGSVG